MNENFFDFFDFAVINAELLIPDTNSTPVEQNRRFMLA
jgi:hypothetical protein